MFVIKDKQMKIFSGHVLEVFFCNAALFLRNEFPETAGNMTEPVLKELISKGISRSAQYKIIERKDVLMYLKCMFLYGTDFDTDPIRAGEAKILKTRNLSGEEKINRLLKQQ